MWDPAQIAVHNGVPKQWGTDFMSAFSGTPAGWAFCAAIATGEGLRLGEGHLHGRLC